MKDAQAEVAAFCREHGLGLDALPRYVDLASEVGELGKALLKAGAYHGRPPETTAEARMEAGDCLFSLLALCEAMGIDAGAALQAALAKYDARFRQKGEIGS